MLDREKEEMYLELKRQGKGPVTCARAVGATVRAMNAHIAADYEFGLRVEEAEAEALERVANAAWERAQGGDWAVASQLLQAKDPDNWMKPDRDINLRVGPAEDIDISELHKRLAAQPPKELTNGDEDRQAPGPVD